jgi:hypothetical protein
MDDVELRAAASRIFSPATAVRAPRGLDGEAEARRVDDRVHAAVGDVGCHRPEPSTEPCVEPVDEAWHVGNPTDTHLPAAGGARPTGLPWCRPSRSSRLVHRDEPVSSATVTVQMRFDPDIGTELGRLHRSCRCRSPADR